jgi:hypothetical protein
VYHLDSSSGASDGSTTPYVDATGNNNHGADYVVTTMNRGGAVGKAQMFSASDYVKINRPVQDDFTIAFWIRAYGESTPGSDWYRGVGLVDGECAGVTDDFGISYLNNTAAFGTGNPDNTIIGTTNLYDGTWHHITATRSSSSGAKRLYIDGTQEATGTGKTGSLSAPPSMTFATLQTIDNGTFVGVIDEVQISSTVLSADRIKLTYLNQKPLPNTAVANIQYPEDDYVIEPFIMLNTPIVPTLSHH